MGPSLLPFKKRRRSEYGNCSGYKSQPLQNSPSPADILGLKGQNSKPHKKLVGRDDVDSSQQIPVAVQAVFLVLNIWIGLQVYLFVRWAETGVQTAAVSRVDSDVLDNSKEH
jgi:hypothetical protein